MAGRITKINIGNMERVSQARVRLLLVFFFFPLSKVVGFVKRMRPYAVSSS